MKHFFLPPQYGFCAGVSSAIAKALKVGDEALKNGGRAFCLGPLVHNENVVGMLEKRGVFTVDSVEDIPDGATMIVRAHGAPPAVFRRAEEKHLTVVDATCPYVAAIQKKAKTYYRKGYRIVLVGEATHSEIIGINGWCENSAIVFDGNSKLNFSAEKALILFQTTFDTRNFEKSLKNISTDCVKTLEIFNTICYTTIERQCYAQKMSAHCDLAVVVGDKRSSNTKRLWEIASANCKAVLTDGTDVDDIDFEKCRNVCFISGASTPSELIKGVLERMVDNAKDAVSVETEVSEETTEATMTEEATVAEPVAEEAAAEEPAEVAAASEKKEEVVMGKDEAMMAEAVSRIREAKYRVGQKVRCNVVLVSEDGVYVRLTSWKQDAFIPNEELALDGNYQAVKQGLEANMPLDCAILSIENGKITLSKKDIDERYKDDELVGDIKEGKEFSCVMTRVEEVTHDGKKEGEKKVDKYLVGRLGSYKVRVHQSQVDIGFVKDLDQYIGKTLRLVSSADKIDEKRHIIRASQKTLLLAERKEKEDEFWNNIAVDEIVEGKVLRFASFGAFVDVRGFDCLAHSSDLSWDRINSPAEVLELGQTYEFVVLALDREHNRVSLGYKQLQPKPWELAEEKFPVGTVVTGKVARMMPYGAFIELDKHIDGLLHVSNYSWDWIDDITKVLNVGDEVEVVVTEFDAEHRRITLSRKALLDRPDNVVTKPE